MRERIVEIATKHALSDEKVPLDRSGWPGSTRRHACAHDVPAFVIRRWTALLCALPICRHPEKAISPARSDSCRRPRSTGCRDGHVRANHDRCAVAARSRYSGDEGKYAHAGETSSPSRPDIDRRQCARRRRLPRRRSRAEARHAIDAGVGWGAGVVRLAEVNVARRARYFQNRRRTYAPASHSVRQRVRQQPPQIWAVCCNITVPTCCGMNACAMIRRNCARLCCRLVRTTPTSSSAAVAFQR